jgi:uncharacterized protein (DUF885 family)
MSNKHADPLLRARRAIETYWAAVEIGPMTYAAKAQPIGGLLDLSEGAALKRAALGRDVVNEIDTIDKADLPADLALTLGVVREAASTWRKLGEWYWLVFDPAQIGWGAMFAAGAYSGGFLLNGLAPIFAAHKFDSRADVDRYLALVSDYARIVRQFDERTRGQFVRGIVMPSVQLDHAITLMEGWRARSPSILAVSDERLVGVDTADARRRIEARITEEVTPAFDAFIAYLSAPAYRASAPEHVGLSQYPGGKEVYSELVRMHLTMDMTIEQVHEAGHARLGTIRAKMQEIMGEAGFAGDPSAYREAIKADPRWRAKDADAVAEIIRSYLQRIAPHIEGNFNFLPQSPCDAAPLPAALEGSMTFGVYSIPKEPDYVGRFMFNTKNMLEAPLMTLASLTYHELIPGHHTHLASQSANEELHPVRQVTIFNAFNEGWAEYAAGFAGELGMYQTLEERFGRLVLDSFVTCRLVVDTGMNALGWSLEQAREFMREHAFLSDAEIASDTLRYSCDIPGQALAYKLADTFLFELREEMRAALGERFRLRDFHDAVLEPGALPLSLVKANVEAATARLLAEAAVQGE